MTYGDIYSRMAAETLTRKVHPQPPDRFELSTDPKIIRIQMLVPGTLRRPLGRSNSAILSVGWISGQTPFAQRLMHLGDLLQALDEPPLFPW